jgi:hypothetical protein
VTRHPTPRNRGLLAAVWLLAVGTAAGQEPMMGPGLIGSAVGTLAAADGSFPGWLYYGVNAADRGLGYNGSYMTLGGFFPGLEDDLGGLWAADLRGHVSVHGGFFSNVGAVRKQFIGGTLLGVGVYWDYDGDMNQYPTGGAPGTLQYGQFGQTYNQVGVSGEWLTNYGNLRSNGYIPVGTTAHTVGNPGDPFVGNWLLCQTGIDAALGGADLELGLYVPALTDWAGMVSVGGYALGNARYTWQRGSDIGGAVVPWFGGVYTRLDMTFAQNWDFSLQANNDSYFDWTGFARLTYRMGGSRRRNVSDQMEQPMMRNEHIVRAHQTPIVAINPETGDPWNVIHVDNQAPLNNARGTVANPFKTLDAAQAAATRPYDIVYLASSPRPYEGGWVFNQPDQLLVGDGSTLLVRTASCGYRSFFANREGATRPIVGNYDGVVITMGEGAVVDNIAIQDGRTGILVPGSVVTAAYVNDVSITNLKALDPPGPSVGVDLTAAPAGSSIQLLNTRIELGPGAGPGATGLDVGASTANVVFQGWLAAPVPTSPAPLPATVQGNSTTDTLNTGLYRNDLLTVPFSPLPVP